MAIKKFIDIRPDERRPAALAFAVLFLMVASHMMLETARDAVFLQALPASRLAFVYGGIALLSFFVLRYSARFGRLVGRRNALIATLFLSASGTTLLYLAPPSVAVIYGLYLWSGLVGTVVVVQFWLLGASLFTVSQAKRIFGVVAAGGALGGLAGAAVSATVVSLVPVQELLLVATGGMLIAAYLLTYYSDDEQPQTLPSPRNAESSGAGTSGATHARYLRRLFALVIVSTATILISDYLFKSTAKAQIASQELPQFFAIAYTAFGALSLLFQISLASYLLRRFGVLTGILFMPLLLAAGGAGVAIVGGALYMVVAAKGVDGALRHSLHRVSSELLWLPIPERVRDRAKGLLDGAGVRAVQGVTAGFLLLLATFNADSALVLGCLIAGLGLLWLILALGMRRPYVGLYRDSLSRGHLDVPSALDLNSLEILVDALSSPEDPRVIASMEMLASQGRGRLIPALILYHRSADVLLRALALVPADDRRDWIPLTEKLLEHDHAEVRARALHVLARHGHRDVLRERLSDISPLVRARALFWLAQTDDAGLAPYRQQIDELIEHEEGGLRQAWAALVRAIAADGDSRWNDVVMRIAMKEQFDDDGLIDAVARLRDPQFIPVLISQLGHRTGRGNVRAALLALGDDAQSALEQAFIAPDTDSRVRLHIPRTISLFANQRAADFLLTRLGDAPNGITRYRMLRVLARTVTQHQLSVDSERILVELDRNLREYYRLLSLSAALEQGRDDIPDLARESGELAQQLLSDKSRQALQRCFILLQIAHYRERVRDVYVAATTGGPQARANALEFVDNLLLTQRYRNGVGNEVRRLLMLALDDLPASEKVTRAAVVADPPTNYSVAISMLLLDKDRTTASIAAFHAVYLGIESLNNEAERIAKQRTLPDAEEIRRVVQESVHVQ